MFRSPIHAGAAILLAAALIAAACARRNIARVPPSPPRPVQIGDTENGIASWYGAPYHGRRAASGEIYDMEQFTAAHRTLPFGTWVEVTNLENGKRANVRITDRGPFVDGRVIDLSHAAAREIEMLGPGTARVRLKVIAAPSPIEQYAVQAGAFSNRDRAESFAASLRDRFEDVRVLESSLESSLLWRVVIGRQMTSDEAKKLAAKVREMVGQAMVVPDN